MDMGRDAEQGVIELVYQHVIGDFTGVLRERLRLKRRGWMRTWALGLVAFACVLNVGLAVAGSEKPDWFLMVWLPAVGALVLLVPRLQARAFLKLANRNGTYRVAVADGGLTMTNDNSTTSLRWAAQPRYRETPDAFFTYSDDKNASCFTVLPKRGLRDPADVDRLRQILDRNLTRV